MPSPHHRARSAVAALLGTLLVVVTLAPPPIHATSLDLPALPVGGRSITPPSAWPTDPAVRPA